MNQKNFELLNMVMQQTAMDPRERERMQQQEQHQKMLEELRITPERELPEMEFLFQLFGKPCFPRGELVAVTGKAKSGKTFFTSMLMTACAGGKVTELCRKPEQPPLKCLWYDTEQSEQSTQEILVGRIGRMACRSKDTDTERPDAGFPAELYDVFNARSLPWESRMGLLESAVAIYHPDLVVVDGVRDLIGDINDGIKAQDVVERFMKMAQRLQCCIVCVLHQNKGAEDRNLRGCIGTEITNKAFEVYACEKLMPQRIFAVEQTYTRKYDIGNMLYFTVDDDGLPCTSAAPETAATDCQQNRKSYPPMNDQYTYWENDKMKVHIRELFYDVLKNYKALYYSDLQKQVMELLNCKDAGYWNNLFVTAKNMAVIVNRHNQQGKSVWALPESQTVESPELFTERDGAAPY